MCKFCDDIYPEDDVSNILFGRGKYKNVAQSGSFISPDAFITVDEDGKFDITVNPGDPYELGFVCDIKFCPYCGRNLKEPVGTFHCKAEESRWQDLSACNDCPNKCEEWYQWDKEMRRAWKVPNRTQSKESKDD